MVHIDLKRSKTFISILNFGGRFKVLPRKYFLSSEERFWKEILFEFSKGDFKGKMFFLPFIWRFRGENVPSTFSKGDFIKSILPERKVGHPCTFPVTAKTFMNNTAATVTDEKSTNQKLKEVTQTQQEDMSVKQLIKLLGSLELINFGWLISKEFVPNIKRFLPPSYLSNETIQN